MKKVIIHFIVLCFILPASLTIYSQDITIDSIFRNSFEIFPFEQIESISSMSIEGEVYLNTDTSLVRVILKDESGVQYMIFETYPLICPGLYKYFDAHCDETCLLEEVNPASIMIQVIDATLNLKSFHYTTDAKENASEERYKAKRALDAQKIETMNRLIPSYNMDWEARDNSIVSLYYEEKRKLFGDGYDLRGFEYYHDGIFEFLGHREYPKVDPDMVKHFDWRERHGANIASSPYWDGDTLGTGWLTSVKNQYPYGTCWAFSAIGQAEAVANLYSNDTLDFDLSERELVICILDTCGPGDPIEALDYLKSSGVVSETCFPYDEMDCGNDTCTDKCSQPDMTLKISLYSIINEENFDNVRTALINRGPLTVGYYHSWGNPPQNHDVVLSGYNFDNTDSSCIWIIKNSWGESNGWGHHGFCNLKIDHFLQDKVAAIYDTIYRNDTALSVNCRDLDGDGLFFWGIGEKPENCQCSNIEDCDDNNKFVGGYDENYYCSCLLEMDSIAHHISGDTTWSDTTYVNYEVVVDSGASLTITSYSAFAPEAKIIVKQGSRLIIDGGYLTKACPDLWQGIEAWGSDTAQGFDQYFGHVIVRNNAIIEFARNAIANHCTDCGYISSQSGGIINADSSIFRNNETDVLFAPFQNMWLGKEYPYFSSFTKCRFTTTGDFYPEFLPKSHIDLKDVYGPMIYGCTFENNSSNEFPFQIRGTGISSIDANFSLLEHCNSPNVVPCDDLTQCEFDGLEYGIKALNSRSVRTLYIRKVNFDENLVGISLSGIDNACILSNDIECPRAIKGVSDDRFSGGLFMEGCSGYHVEGNYFHALSSMESGVSPAYGIGIKNSGPDDNEIYNNTFYRLETGIISIGENRGNGSGLCLKCNDMSRDTNDFIVVEDEDPPLGVYQGINKYQGNPKDSLSDNAPAGNTFSFFNISADSTNVEYYNYLNAAEDIWYVHHQRQLDPLTYPLDDNYTKETIELKGWQTLVFEKDSACPSGLGGGGTLKSYTNSKLDIIEADNQIGILTNQLNSLIDGGNTDELNFEVMTSMPYEGLEIRQQLLSDSPYLSDTVLKQAIYKEDVLPNAMIRDVLEANPQSAKSDEILNTLASRFETMPDYMMEQIVEGKKYLGAKELLEAEIQTWKQFRAKAKSELFRQFLLDTTMVNPLDSVIAFLETENDLKSRYDLAFAYWNKLDSANAMLTINNIPLQFDLNDNQYVVHQQYEAYFEIIRQMQDNNWRACDLDSTSVQILFDLMDGGNADMAACSRGLLVKGGFFDYIEIVNIPDYSKSGRPHYISNDNIVEAPTQDCLRLFPNPAGDYVIAYYDIDLKYKSGEITINDIKGNLLRSYTVSSGKNQLVLDLKNLSNGLYVISLNANHQIIESKKLSKGGY